MFKILDCTIRDGGYYTNWDFNKALVDQYIESMNKLPVDYLEIGYRSKPLQGYLGKYFYNPSYELLDLKSKSNKKLVVILNEKDVRVEHLDELLTPIKGIIDMVRIAIDPEHLGRAISLAEGIKKMGFEVGFNVMYMSKWNQYSNFMGDLKFVDGVADYFYMVDSYGGVFPKDVIETIGLVKSNTAVKLGFHGHNNLELALINSLTAVEHGVEIIDSTVWGMGRGAGNLKTELLLAVLNSKYGLSIDFNALGDAVSAFDDLLRKYEWGTNLPYMISGSNSLPQKDVMDWVTTRFYSFNSIIRALQNQKEKVKDNERLPLFEPQSKSKQILIIAGGKSASEHASAVLEFVKQNEDMTIIHASSKNAYSYKDIKNEQIFCLIGNEGRRMEKVFDDFGHFNGICVLPPYPRKMGTYVPELVYGRTFELPAIDFTSDFKDSHTALALQTALTLGAEKIYVIGYDGYQDVPISSKERTLTNENEALFAAFHDTSDVELYTLISSNYSILKEQSLYSLLD
ncbi:aldolase catalytic domain-containing protein [Mucilaginibacter paludis]|nr:aldolase catalytic domain-containing protein [Mucilaginibacter paludis]